MPITPNRGYRLGEDSEVDPIDALNEALEDIDADVAALATNGKGGGGATATQVTVPANRADWTRLGVTLTGGDALAIAASGKVGFNSNPDAVFYSAQDSPASLEFVVVAPGVTPVGDVAGRIQFAQQNVIAGAAGDVWGRVRDVGGNGDNQGAFALTLVRFEDARTAFRLAAQMIRAYEIAGLGNAATRDVGTTAGTVAPGDDPRFGAAFKKSGTPGKLALAAQFFIKEVSNGTLQSFAGNDASGNPVQRILFSPWLPTGPTTIDAISYLVRSAAPAGSGAYVRAALYDSTPDFRPRLPIAVFGSATAETPDARVIIQRAKITLNAGVYWLALQCIGDASGGRFSALGIDGWPSPIVSATVFDEALTTGSGFSWGQSIIDANNPPAWPDMGGITASNGLITTVGMQGIAIRYAAP